MAHPPEGLAHVIQLAITPVFLLSALGSILSVLSSRLSRIVDRLRVIDDGLETITQGRATRMHFELGVLLHRRRLMDLAITSATASALIVCVLVALSFIRYLLGLAPGMAVAILFIVAMFSFVAALGLFLAEVLYASAVMRHEKV